MSDKRLTDKPRVFVPQPVSQAALQLLSDYAEIDLWTRTDRAISIPELEAGCARNDYLFGYPHSMPITATMIAANPHLKGIAIDSLPVTTTMRPDISGILAANEAGVPLLIEDPATKGDQTPPPANSSANLMISMLLNFAYNMVEADRYARCLGYFQELTMDLMGTGTYGFTVSLIGLGKIGRAAVAPLHGLGLEIVYTDPVRLSENDEQALGVTYVEELDELVARGDFVSLLARYDGTNANMIGAHEFAQMKPTAFFINTARGELVDQDALIEALENGRIAGAGLDVFIDEPPLVNQPHISERLRKAKNTILTPHIGGVTADDRGRGAVAIAQLIVNDIKAREANGEF